MCTECSPGVPGSGERGTCTAGTPGPPLHKVTAFKTEDTADFLHTQKQTQRGKQNEKTEKLSQTKEQFKAMDRDLSKIVQVICLIENLKQ